MKWTVALPLVVLVALAYSVSDVESKVLICYFGSWSVYRPGPGKFDVEDIDPFLCTHVIFGFAALNENTNEIMVYDPWNELSPTDPGAEPGAKGAYRRFTGLKNRNPALKTLLAIGGWNEGSEKYSKMVAVPSQRQKFIQSVLRMLINYGFDGLDFDWEYPGTRGGNPAIDKENFILMIQELKAAFQPFGFLLTSAVSPGQVTIDIAYDIPRLSAALDFINLMGYDYHGAWEIETGLNSPMYQNLKYDVGNETTLNVQWSVDYWIQKGADRNKLILGMPTYGRGFLLDDPSRTDIKSPARLPIDEGPYTRLNGTWSYLEICEKKRDQSNPLWTIVQDPCYQAPYMYRNRQWIGYDDVASITRKTSYMNAMNLGGALIWSIDQDDFRGSCGGGAFTLTNTIKRYLNGPASFPPKCPGEGLDTTTTSTTTTTTPSTTTSTTTPTTTTSTTTPTTTTSTTTPTTTTSTTTPTTTTSTTTPTTTTSTTSPTTTTSTTTPTTTTSTTTPTTTTSTTTPTTTTSTTTPTTTTSSTTSSTTTSTTTPATTTSTTTPSTITPTTAATTTPGGGGNGGLCRAAGLNPYPGDCAKFLNCVPYPDGGWLIYVQTCAPGTYFDPNIMNCNTDNGHCQL